MRDRLVLPILVLVGLAMIALSLVWPQGLGRRSSAPFGHAMVAAEAKAAGPERPAPP
ncbi:MAG: hypothetical protein ABI906_08735 [Pseudomonadota bacterium]